MFFQRLFDSFHFMQHRCSLLSLRLDKGYPYFRHDPYLPIFLLLLLLLLLLLHLESGDAHAEPADCLWELFGGAAMTRHRRLR